MDEMVAPRPLVFNFRLGIDNQGALPPRPQPLV